MTRIKNNYNFWYQGNPIDRKFCSVRVLNFHSKQLEKDNKLEEGSVTYQLDNQ